MPLPTGYTLDQNNGPSLPPGYTLDQPPNIADIARQRLAARGLTPERVKAGGGVTKPEDIKFKDPETHFWGGVGHALNPANLVHIDPVTKTIMALTGHGDLPGMQGMRAARARGETPGAMDMASGTLQETGLPDFVGTAQESYHRGEANQTRSDLYGGVAGSVALGALTHGVTKALPALAPGRVKAGVAQYADALAPADSANRPLAESIASQLGDEGITMRNPKKQLGPLLEKRAEGIDTTAPILNRPQAARVGPILSEIEAQRDALFNEVQRVPAPADPQYRADLIAKLKRPMGEVVQDGNELVVREIAHPDFWTKANELSKLREHITQSSNRGMIRNDVLDKLTKDYNYVGGTVEGGYKNPGIDPRYLPASTNAADAIRDVVNQDPAAAAANAQKSELLTAAKELPSTAQSPRPIAPVVKRLALNAAIGVGSEIAGTHGVPGSIFGEMYGLPRAALNIGELVNRVRTNPLFRTTAGSYKMQLGKAIQAKNFGEVSRLATPLMTGAGLEDAFGHDAAVHQAVTDAFAQANGDLNLARQDLLNQEAVYENPDGSRVAVPAHVYRSFASSIGADSKYGNSGMATSNAQGGPNQGRGASDIRQQAGQRGGGEVADRNVATTQETTYPRLRSSAIEFPPSGERDENDSMFMRRTGEDGRPLQFPVPVVMPSQVLPRQFVNARNAQWGAPLMPGLKPGELPNNKWGEYGRTFDPRKPQDQTYNNVLIAKSAADEPIDYAHEVNHAVYRKDLTEDQRNAFRSKVVESINAAAAARQSGGVAAEKAVIAGIPKAVVSYANQYPRNHERAFNEAFAELGAQYMLNPTAFKTKYPDWYDMFRDFYGGKEYVGGK